MTTSPLSPQRSRGLAIGLLLVVTIGVLLVAVMPVFAAYQTRLATIESQQIQISKLSRLASQQAVLQRQLDQAKQTNPSIAYYVAGASPALAAANLQRYIKQIVDRRSGELISTQIIPASGDDDSSAAMTVHLKCDMRRCFPILFDLESGKPMLFVDNLVINARSIPARKPEQVPSVELDIRFDATGFLLEQGR